MIASVISAGAPLCRIVGHPPPFEHNHRSSSHTQFGGLCRFIVSSFWCRYRAALAITAGIHGRTNHPAIIVVASDEALVEKVESTPASSVWWTFIRFLEGVNVLRASGKLPLEPGYPLRGN